MSNFGALLEGLMTVRAFCAQKSFRDKCIDSVDTFQKMYVYRCCTNVHLAKGYILGIISTGRSTDG